MRKKLIAAIIVALILLVSAVGVLIFMENRPVGKPGETSVPGATENQQATEDRPVETTTETIGISLPTENPDEAAPEDTFGEDNQIPPVTVDTDVPATTEDPDANALPEDEF